MANANVTWKGAVKVDSYQGQHVDSAHGVPVVHSAEWRGEIGRGERGVHEAALSGGVPYMAAGEDFDWAEEFAETAATLEG